MFTQGSYNGHPYIGDSGRQMIDEVIAQQIGSGDKIAIKQHCIQSDGEPRCYNQVCQSYANITLIFPPVFAHFGTFSVITLVL